MQNKEIENLIVKCLSKLGISIHIYHAFSTSSIYIKLDYGALGSIRISDHTGKEKYRYKYNIGKNIEKYKESCEDNCIRKFYPANQVQDLLCDILLEHNAKIHTVNYLKIKQKYKDNKKDVSFWRNCKEIAP